MWRSTGPIIISMSYMILDVLVFLLIFVIVYISFTLSMVHVYSAYDMDRTQHFNTHKMAFKLFFWALIRTGNPQFAGQLNFVKSLRIFLHGLEFFSDIRVFNATETFNKTCLSSAIETSDLIGSKEVKQCSLGLGTSEYEEEVPYISGNILWAIYQFTVFIVLLSILRARMVNTYHRIFKEADVQWKYFRYFENFIGFFNFAYFNFVYVL